MPTITEEVVTRSDTDYVLPIWRKKGTTMFIKIYDTDKMLVVENTAGKEQIGVYPYPSLGITAIASDTVTQTELQFTTAYDAVKAIIEAL